MPRAYPAEFRRRAIALVEAGQSVAKTANDLGITGGALYHWIKQDKIDHGEMPGQSNAELEAEVEILRRANELLGPDAKRPKGFTR